LLAEVTPLLNADLDESGPTTVDSAAAGPNCAPDISQPVGGGTGAGVSYIHGVGFIGGSVDSDHAIAVSIAREIEVTVVSEAPEDPFPARIEDWYLLVQRAAGGVGARSVSHRGRGPECGR
jgi:acetyl esterase/lipase